MSRIPAAGDERHLNVQGECAVATLRAANDLGEPSSTRQIFAPAICIVINAGIAAGLWAFAFGAVCFFSGRG